MKRIIAAFTPIFLVSTAARADVNIKEYSENLFQGCVSGDDIGVLTGVSNPLLLLGSMVYSGNVLTPQGPKPGLVRQPLALPLITSDAASPDISTCEHNFSVKNDGNLTFLGFSLSASKSDIYKVRVRLVSRQKVAPVAQNGALVQPWFSDTWKPMFKQVVDSADSNVSNFYIFDNISIYLLDVEKYKKVNGGLAGVFGINLGGANYAKDDSFKGTKLIVTGDTVPLSRNMFGPITFPSSVVTPDASQSLRILDPAEAATINARFTSRANSSF